MKPAKPPNKHQLKSEATRRVVLEAAEKIFVRDGYAGTQIEAIAQEIGRTKGAVYAQFKSKEDLFLALLELHIRRRMDALLPTARDLSPEDQLRAVREQFLVFAAEENWTILLLEFKLHAYRNPATCLRIGELYEVTYRELQQAQSEAPEEVSEAERQAFRQTIAFTRALPGAVALERYFEPSLGDREATSQLMRTVFDAVRPTKEQAAKASPDRPR